MVSFAGYTVSSKVKYTFKDTVSVSNTLGSDSKDFCGDKQLEFLLNGTTKAFLSNSNDDFFISAHQLILNNSDYFWLKSKQV